MAMRGTAPLIRFFILLALCGCSIHGAPKKWHPGHYMLVYNNASQRRYDIIFESPYWLGVQVRYTWPQLEPEKDRYDFSAIISDIDYLKPHGKRLVVQFQKQLFTRDGLPVPDYLQTEEYGGGYEPFPNKNGAVARIWDSRVMDRYVKLLEAMAAELDTIPWVEAIVLSETAIDGKQNMPGYTNDGYRAELKKLVRAAGTAFEKTVTILYGNWLPAGMNLELARECYDYGVGWGGPDSPNDDSWFNSPHSGYVVAREYAGRIPLGYAVQSSGYCGSAGCWPVDEMFAWANENLNVNYRFWLRNNQGSPTFDDDVLPYVNKREGEITTACPENIECEGSSPTALHPAAAPRAISVPSGSRMEIHLPGVHRRSRAGDRFYGLDGRRLSESEIATPGGMVIRVRPIAVGR
jgi:hypothetical protein